MKQVTVVYWSGTGNTELMAKAVAEGAKSAGATVKLLSVEDASPEEVLAADAIALGCPAMGDEVLEESFMDPFVEALEGQGIEGLHWLSSALMTGVMAVGCGNGKSGSRSIRPKSWER